MKRAGTIAMALLSLGLAGAAAQQSQPAQPGQAGAQQPRPEVAKTHLKVGDMAPDFTLRGTGGREPVKLSDFRGKKNVVLAFYVLAFTGG